LVPHRFASYLVFLGFVEAKSDTLLFVYCRDADTVYLLLYVNDIVTASRPELLQSTTTPLQRDLGPLYHFQGVSVEQRHDNLFLHQC
jgi:hypothetical protein